MATDAAPGQAPATAPAGRKQGGGGVFTRKIGPFPAWVWMAIAAAGVLALVVYEYRKNSAGGSSAATDSAATSPATPPTVFTFPPESNPGAATGTSSPDDPSIYALAKKILEERGVKNPTVQQIDAERKKIIDQGQAPAKKKKPGRKPPKGTPGGPVMHPGKRAPLAHHRHKAAA